MGKSLRSFVHNMVSYIRHPFGVTCLDCGFLALEQQEIDKSKRIQLHCKGTAGCPPLEYLRCFRSLWVDLDLTYSSGYPADDIFDIVEKQQRNCEGYFRYRPGWSPSDHRDLLLKTKERWVRLLFALLGVVLTVFGMWLAKKLGLK